MVLSYITEFYRKYEDPRVEDKLFMGTPPLKFATLVFGYIFLIHFGPTLMKNRKPFELNYVMKAYNIFQVIVNGYFGLYGLIYMLILNDYNYACPPKSEGTDTYNMTFLKLAHVCFLTKVFDLVDTVFIVLKKKHEQRSFLHCYHHLIMVLGSYWTIKFRPDIGFSLLGIVNSLVHSIMYFYYFMTTQSSTLRKSVTWKRQITHIQMIQFVLLACTFMRPMFTPGCTRSKIVDTFMASQSIFIFFMFAQFYYKTYIVKKPAKKSD